MRVENGADPAIIKAELTEPKLELTHEVSTNNAAVEAVAIGEMDMQDYDTRDSSFDSAADVEADGSSGGGGRQGAQPVPEANTAEKDKKIAEMILECDEDADDVNASDDDEGEDGVGGLGHDGGASGDYQDRRSGAHTGGDVSDSGSGTGLVGGVPSAFYKRKPVKTRWSAQEDAWLKVSVEAHGNSNWKRVSYGCCCPIGTARLFRNKSERESKS